MGSGIPKPFEFVTCNPAQSEFGRREERSAHAHMVRGSAAEAARSRRRGPTVTQAREEQRRKEQEEAECTTEDHARRSAIGKAVAAKVRERLVKRKAALREKDKRAGLSKSARKYSSTKGNVTTWNIAGRLEPGQFVPPGYVLFDGAGMIAFLESGVVSKCCGISVKYVGFRANESKGHDEYVMQCQCCKHRFGMYAGHRVPDSSTSYSPRHPRHPWRPTS